MKNGSDPFATTDRAAVVATGTSRDIATSLDELLSPPTAPAPDDTPHVSP